MSSPRWILDQQTAQLQAGELRASIDLSRPGDGLGEVCLGEVCLGDEPLVEARFLALALPGGTPGEAGASVERYVRGDDLITSCRESVAWPVRVDAVWHARVPGPGERFLAALELIVSVSTALLDSQPELTVYSRLRAAEVLHLDAARAVAVPLSAWEQGAPMPDCVLVRLPGGARSYAEMVDRDGGERQRQIVASGREGPMEIRHRLFPESLEKGVMLRARIRGVWLPRSNDAELAAEFCRTLAAAEPPLGT